MSQTHDPHRRRLHDPHAGTAFAHAEEMRVTGAGSVPPGGVSLLASMIIRSALTAWRAWERWRERR